MKKARLKLKLSILFSTSSLLVMYPNVSPAIVTLYAGLYLMNTAVKIIVVPIKTTLRVFKDSFV